jgi:hypothetical protein
MSKSKSSRRINNVQPIKTQPPFSETALAEIPATLAHAARSQSFLDYSWVSPRMTYAGCHPSQPASRVDSVVVRDDGVAAGRNDHQPTVQVRYWFAEVVENAVANTYGFGWTRLVESQGRVRHSAARETVDDCDPCMAARRGKCSFLERWSGAVAELGGSMVVCKWLGGLAPFSFVELCCRARLGQRRSQLRQRRPLLYQLLRRH